MPKKKLINRRIPKRLGRGLEGLINNGTVANQSQTTLAELPGIEPKNLFSKEYFDIPIENIEPNRFQPRQHVSEESISELAQSIRLRGLLQPILVRPKKYDGKYELIAGERRWLACKSLGMSHIVARILNVNDVESASLALIENLQREALNPIDQALAFSALLQDFGLTQEQLAERVGKARTSITNTLRLLKLEVPIQKSVSEGTLSMGHARALLSLPESNDRFLLFKKIVDKGLSVRETERSVQQVIQGPNKVREKADKNARYDEETRFLFEDLELKMRTRLEAKVALKPSSVGGKIVINYGNNEELFRIMNSLGIH